MKIEKAVEDPINSKVLGYEFQGPYYFFVLYELQQYKSICKAPSIMKTG